MSFRTSTATQQRQSLQDLQATQERMALNNARITSGNRIGSPGEDPTGAAAILDFGNSIDANTQYLKQIDSASAYLTTAENAVNGAVESVMRLGELAVSGSSASVPEVNAILQNLLALANTQSQGKYIFSGTKTNTQPFGDPLAPYTYQGNREDINLGVATGTLVSTNLTGDQVFLGGKGLAPGASPSDLFTAVQNLATGLLNGNNATVQTATTGLDAALANLNQMLAELGGRQAGLQSLQTSLGNFNASLQALQTDQQATDYPTAIMEYTNDQTIQSATLSVMAKVNKVNLFDYLA
ncbi:MAG: flagellar hook-associated protein FlgL [Holophagaceae bacterium]